MIHRRTAAALLVPVALASTLAIVARVDAASPGGAVVTDGFNRTDASSLGQTETGQAWIPWIGAPSIVGQQAQMAGGYTLAVVDTGTVEGSVAATVATASSEFWLIVRASDSANYWRFGRWQGGNYQLQQVAHNGLGSPSVTAPATRSAANGDRVSCQLAAGISCSVNGTTVVTTADPFNSSARFAGLAAMGATATRFDDLVVTLPQASPDLHVTAAAASGSASVNSPVSWTGTVVNQGERAATGTTVTVNMPASLTNTSVSSTIGPCTGTGAAWTCALGDRPVGASATITVQGTSPAQPATLTVTLTASSAEPDANTGDNTASATITTPPGAVAVDGFGRPDAGSLGQAESGQPWAGWIGSSRVAGQQAEVPAGGYSLVVVDSSTAVGTASLRVTSPSAEYWLIVRASNSANYWRFGRWQGGAYQLQQVNNNGLGSPPLTLLSAPTPAAGDQLSCYLSSGLTCAVNGTAVVRTTDAFNSTARNVGFAANAGAPTRFDDLLVTTPQPGPDLQVAVTSPAGTVSTGAPVAWSGTVANNGTQAAAATVVTVTPPSELTASSVSTSAGPCTPSGGTWSCAVGSRAVGTSFTVSVSGTAPAQAASLTLTVAASSSGTDLDPSDNSASSTVNVRPPPPPGTIAMDGFDRPDSSTLGQADTGQTWTTWLGSTRRTGQQAEATSGYALAVLDSGTASGTASLTVTAPSSEFWMIVRASNSTNYWRFGRWQGGPYQLQQIVNNGLGSPAMTTTATVMPAAGDRLSCKLGSGVSCSVNGIAVVSTASAFNVTARFTGFAAASIPVRFDDLLVTTPPPGPDLQVAVTAAASAVETGKPVSWTATVVNDGTQTATATVVTVTPPAGLTSTSVASSAGLCLPSMTTWSCAVGNRAVGSSLTVTVNANAPSQPGSISLSVSAASQEADTEPATNTGSASIIVRAPAAPGSVVADGFDRPNASTLGQADTGQPWSTLSGGFGVSNGAAAPTVAGTNVAVLDPGWQYGTYEVSVKAGAAPNAFAVIVRGRDANNHVRIGPDSSGYYRIWKVVNGAAQPLAIALRRADVAPTNGDVIRIVNRPDDGLFVSVNGQHILDAGDQALLSESRFGLVATSLAVRFDSLWISQVMSSGVTTTDTFDDPDGTMLADSSSPIGTHYPWHASYGWQSQAGRLVIPGYGLAWIDTTSELANPRVEVRSGAAEAFLVFRYDENGDYYHFGHAAGGNYVVEKVVNGNPVAVAMQANLAPQAVDVLEVRQSTAGRIEALVDGVKVADFVDSTFNKRTTAYGLEGNAATFDSFSVTPK